MVEFMGLLIVPFLAVLAAYLLASRASAQQRKLQTLYEVARSLEALRAAFLSYFPQRANADIENTRNYDDRQLQVAVADLQAYSTLLQLLFGKLSASVQKPISSLAQTMHELLKINLGTTGQRIEDWQGKIDPDIASANEAINDYWKRYNKWYRFFF